MSDIATEPVRPQPWADAKDMAAQAAEGVPQRTDPRSVLAGFVTSLPQMLYVIPALLVGGDQALPYLIFVIPVMIAFASFGHWLHWWHFTYCIQAEDIRVEQGIFSRKSRSVPFERIQDVGIERKPVARLLGLAAVKIETGGGKGEDAELSYLKLPDAEALRDLIRDRKHGVVGTAPAALLAGEDLTDSGAGASLFTMDNRRLLLAGLFNFSLILIGVIGALLQQFQNLLPDYVWDPRFWLAELGGIDVAMIRSIGLVAQIVAGLALVLMLLAIGVISGIVRTVLRDYGFRLDRVPAGFRRRRGLLTLTDVVLPKHRVQAGLILTGPIRRHFGWRELKFQSLAQDSKAGSDHSVAPLASSAEIDPILAEAALQNSAVPAQYSRTRMAPFLFLWCILAMVLCIAATMLWLLVHPLAGTAIYAIAGFLPLLAWLRWRHHRYALVGGQLYVHAGWWRQRLSLLPAIRTQTADLSYSPIDRLFGTASLVLGVAGGSASFPLQIRALPESDAIDLRDRIMAAVTSIDFSDLHAPS